MSLLRMDTIEINSINITTVCSLNNTEYQCTCNNPYSWPCEKCSRYGFCNNNKNNGTNSTCFCNNSIPYDGQVCQPISELLKNSTCPAERPTVPTEVLEYVLIIEVNVSQEIVFKQIQLLLDNMSPLRMDTIEINSINITTVCSLNNTEYQCTCNNPYSWPCEKCSQYGFCNNNNNIGTNSSCFCNNSIPYDGQVCRPISELLKNSTCPAERPTVPTEVLEYVIIIEVNVSQEIVFKQIQLLLNNMRPLRMDTIEVNSINITTVCSLNNTEYQCTCNNPYSWPCEKCSRYGFCNNNNGTNSTCFCNNSIPYDGQVCQPISELLKNSTCPAAPTTVKDGLYQSNGNIYPGTDLNLNCTSPAPTNITWTLNGAKLNESSNILSLKNVTPLNSGEYACKTTVNSVPYIIRQNITIQPYPDIKVTPDKVVECKITTITLQCCVQLVYQVEWNTTSCASTSRDPVTGCISCDYTVNDQQCQTNDQVAQFTCQLKNPINGSTNPDHKLKTITINIPKPVKVLNLLLKINEEFDIELTNKSSTKYSNFKKQMENSIDESYSTVPGYKMNSITVTGFRSGSVIVDFTIQSTNANIDLISANQNLVQSLRTLGYNVSDDAFSHSVKDGLYQGSGNIYPGTDLNLNCTSPAPTDITWTLNGAKLPESSSILSLKNVTPLNSGEYACITTVNHLAYIIWQIITIQPYPDIQVTTDKIVACKITTIPLLCCVQLAYQVEWDTTQPECQSAQDPVTGCISCDYTVNNQQCQTNDQVAQFTCKLKNPISGFTNTAQNLKTIKLSITNREFACFDPIFGSGNVGEVQIGNCSENMVGFQVAQCSSSKIWQVTEDKCVLRIFNYFNVEAKTLQVTNLPQFMANVIVNATLEKENIVDSSATILTIVEILTIISNLSQTIVINKPVMTNFLEITDVIGSDGAQETWAFLNSKKDSMNASSELLNATESIARRLPDNDISITTNFSSLNKTSISAPFSGEFGQNLTTLINIPVSSAKTFLTVIISLVFNNILPVRNLTYNDSSQTGTSINGDVAMIETSSKINNISLSFNTKNKTLGNPQCVFWNFSLLDNVGGWDSTGCQLKTFGNELERYTCECSHTTSFSMLMSPFSPVNCALDVITYVGVGISMGSLVLCLIIEFIAWKFGRRNEKFYQRHVAIINIAVSLLIANICFIIAAAVVKKEVNQCSTATFFMHFFYLAVFFWILLLALLLLLNVYTIVPIMTTKTMMGIAFSVGYGAPLLIAVITVASTAGRNGYIQRGYNCWLNWNETKALLAFVIPALTIVAINLLVLVVVLCKIFIRPVTAHMSRTEKNPLLVIARCVAILTPLFGLTWGFGIGTLVSPECGIHIVFAFLNSLQGFFILVFGTLMDHKVREVLAQKLALRSVSSGTRTTSGGPTSSSGFNVFQRFRQRNGYNVASDERFSSSN